MSTNAPNSAGGRLWSTVQSAASVIAPITVVGAVLGYIGWVRTREFYSYFGLNPALIGFSPQDQLLRSVDVGFGAIFALCIAALVGVTADTCLVYSLRRFERRAAQIRGAVVLVGGLLIVAGLFLGWSGASRALDPGLPGAGLVAVGAVTILRTNRLGNEQGANSWRLTPAASGVGWALLVLSLFWGANAYARDLGLRAAQWADASVSARPAVTVYSTTQLDLVGGEFRQSKHSTR